MFQTSFYRHTLKETETHSQIALREIFILKSLLNYTCLPWPCILHDLQALSELPYRLSMASVFHLCHTEQDHTESLGKMTIFGKGPNPYSSLPTLIYSSGQEESCVVDLVPFHRHVSCRHVLGRAWKSSQGCPVAVVMRNCNSEKEREGKDQIWDGHSTLCQGSYSIWLQNVCADSFSVWKNNFWSWGEQKCYFLRKQPWFRIAAESWEFMLNSSCRTGPLQDL